MSKYTYKYKFFVVLLSVLVGLITGSIAAIFGMVLLKITFIRELYPHYFLPFLPLVGLAIVYVYKNYGKEGKKGMSQVFEVAHSKSGKLPLRMIPLVTISTWITHLFGASAGREGVSVQIGGVVGYNVGRLLKDDDIAHILLISGMAAGFSGLFQTPIAAVFFALEILVVGNLKYYALLPAMCSSLFAYLTSRFIGLEQFRVPLDLDVYLDFSFLLKLIIISIFFGIAGKLFAELLSYFKKLFSDKIDNPYKKIFIIGLFISVLSLLIYSGRYSGLGTNIISLSFNDGDIYYYDWLLKLLFTVVSLAAGFQGGEVTPIFAIGASLGVVLSGFIGVPILLGAALGYAAVFSASTKTLIGPIFIGAEVFGFEYIHFFVLACTISFFVSGKSTIYSKQVNSFIDNIQD